MKHNTEADRAEFEDVARNHHHFNDGCHTFKFDTEFDAYDEPDLQCAFDFWLAARRAPAAPVPQIDPVNGDCLPPIGSRVFIRHGRDHDAHACIVTGYYAWGDLKGSKHLHRVFVHLVYEGTDTKQARMLCDCYASAEDALAAAPQPPEAAPVQLPEPAGVVVTSIGNYASVNAAPFVRKGDKFYTERQVRELLAAHGIGGAA